VIRIGHDAAYPPWVYIGSTGAAGFTVDILKLVGQRIGESFEFVPDQFVKVMEDLDAGRVRIAANIGWPNSILAALPVVATRPFARFEPVLFMRKAEVSKVRELDHACIDGLRIAVQKGSYVRECLDGFDCSFVETDNDILGFTKLIWKQVDAVITERKVGEFTSRSFFRNDVVIGFETGISRDVVCLLHKRDTELRDRIDKALSDESTGRDIRKILGR